MADNTLPRIADNTAITAEFVFESAGLLEQINETMQDLSTAMFEFLEFQRSEAIRAKLATDNLADTISDSLKPDSSSDDNAAPNSDSGGMAWEEYGLASLAAIAAVASLKAAFLAQVDVIKTFGSAAKALVPARLVEIFSELRTGIVQSVTNLTKGIDSAIDFVRSGVSSGLTKIGALLSFADDSPFISGIRSAIDAGVSRLTTLLSFADDSSFISGIRSAIDAGVSRLTTLFTIGDDSMLVRMVNALKNSLSELAKPFQAAFTMVQGMITPITSVVDSTSNISSYFSNISRLFSTIGRVLKTVFVPLGIIITVVDTIKGAITGFEEGGILGAIEGAITGLFTSLIGAPLDMIKSAVGWVLGIFGSDNARAILESFSFSQLISDGFGGLFDMFTGAFEWIASKFNADSIVSGLSALFTSALGGFTSLMDLMHYPINKAVDLIMNIFGWKDEGAEPFSIVKFVSDGIQGAIDWVAGIFSPGGITAKLSEAVDFAQSMADIVVDAWESIKTWLGDKLSAIADFLPSIDDIKQSLLSRLPRWLIPESEKTPEMRAEDMSRQIMQLESDIAENSFRSVGLSADDEKEELQRLRVAREQLLAEQDARATNNAVVVNNIRGGDNNARSSVVSAPYYGGAGMEQSGMRPDRS